LNSMVVCHLDRAFGCCPKFESENIISSNVG